MEDVAKIAMDTTLLFYRFYLGRKISNDRSKIVIYM
jgi:hypothetical protein